MEEEAPRTELRRPSRAPWIVLAVAVVIAAGVLLWLRHRAAPPPAAPIAQSPSPTSPEVPVAPPAATPVAPTVEGVSDHPLYRRGLKEGDLERRWAIVTDNLAEGVSPRKALEFLAPSQPFSVVRRGDRIVIAPQSYHRYDAFADAVASVNVPVLVAVYRHLHGAIETAYRSLGYPDASLDAVTVRALRRVASAPVRDVEVPVENVQGVYVYGEPRLEDLGAVEKHLLRMGPRNERLIQAKARELLHALGPAQGAAAPAAPAARSP